MKKQILNLGKALNKVDQKAINGGGAVGFCDVYGNCPSGQYCKGDYCYMNGSGGNGGGDTGGDNCTGPWLLCPNGDISCTGC